jgi:PKD repeat protein
VVGLVLTMAVLAALLVLPAQTAVAPSAGALDVPACLPGQTDNCLAPDTNIPDGVERPADPVLTPPVPYGDFGDVVQYFSVSNVIVGKTCPVFTIELTDMPCTHLGVFAGVGVYQPGRDVSGSPLAYGIGVQDEPVLSCRGYVHTCTKAIVYNPRTITGTLTLIVNVYTDVTGDLNGDGNVSNDNVSYSFSLTLGGSGQAKPTASFTQSGVGSAADPMTFLATSTDPGSEAMTHQWSFGDGGTASGGLATHSYARPGTYSVTLTSTTTSGRSGSVTKNVVVAPPTLGLAVDLLDGAAPPLAEGKPVRAKVTVSASSSGVGAIDGIRFDGGDLLGITPEGAFVVTDGPTPAVPTSGFSLQAGDKKEFEVTLEPHIVGRYDLVSKVTGTDGTGATQTADADSPGEIGQALTIDIALDPPTAKLEEGPDGAKPIDVTATLTFTNTTDTLMDEVTLTSLRVDRTAAGQLLAVTQTGGADPGEDGLAVGSLAPGQSKQLTATFRATDDAEVEFTALATAHLTDGRNEIGVGRRRWSVKPQYLLGLTTRVVNPAGSALLPAGETVRITGTVKNLSSTATIEIGPLYPTLTGNAGAMSLAWDAQGSDPKELSPAGNLTLEPGESRDLTVRFLTGWSDPRGIEGDNPSGGTFATATFTPWGVATNEDGTTEDITPTKVKATAEDLTHRISIDDSIAIPTTDPLALAGAISVGTLEGVWSGTANVISSTVDLVKLPYTVIVATGEFQAQVWDSFTEEEKQAFADDAGLMTAAILARNAEFGTQGAAALWDTAKSASYAAMTEMANQWAIGDYTSTAELYSKYAADAVTQIAVPVALAKLAKSPRAVAALARAQEALQTKMAPILAKAPTLTRIEELGPVLSALQSGTELTAEQLSTLYGITAEELVELQKVADDLNVLLTVRSRHASSIEWIERFDAMLKPETLKIKTVSELDVKLGYRESDVGSLVFRKPEPLKAFDAGQGDLGTLIDEFVNSKGFVTGTPEWESAVARVGARASEWRTWEKYYKRWDAQGWIDVSMNYKGNAITDPLVKGKSSLGVAPLESGKYVGFELAPVGDEEYVLQMMNNRVGRFVPITGDIDPIAFTHLDGSPLTMEEHLAVLDKLAKNPLLQAQHGESATYTGGGLDFIESQFKPGEPGVQIAPSGHAPRVVRFDKSKSRWANSFDYHLHWEGGFVYSGSYVPKGAIPRAPIVVPPTVEPLPTRPRAIPQATTTDANVGRCRITYSTVKDSAAAIMDIRGKLVNLGGDGKTVQDSPLHSECFAPGPVIERQVKPVTGLTSDATVGQSELPIPEGDPWLATAGSGLAVGDEVTIGAGTPDAETHVIIAFGSIILDQPLRFDHPAGSLIVVTKGTEPSPTTTTTMPPTTTTVIGGGISSGSDPATEVEAASAAAPTGALPYTGIDLGLLAWLTVGLLGGGLVLVATVRARHAASSPGGRPPG